MESRCDIESILSETNCIVCADRIKSYRVIFQVGITHVSCQAQVERREPQVVNEHKPWERAPFLMHKHRICARTYRSLISRLAHRASATKFGNIARTSCGGLVVGNSGWADLCARISSSSSYVHERPVRSLNCRLLPRTYTASEHNLRSITCRCHIVVSWI